jgi:hypothetical protein
MVAGQVAFADASVDVVPGQHFVQGARSRVKACLRPGLAESLPPGFHLELVAPAVKAGAELPGAVDDCPQPPVAAGEHRLQQRLLVVIPVQLQARSTQMLLQIVLLGADLGLVGQGQPLERGVGLGDQC